MHARRYSAVRFYDGQLTLTVTNVNEAPVLAGAERTTPAPRSR
jgi:hypothetical protein